MTSPQHASRHHLTHHKNARLRESITENALFFKPYNSLSECTEILVNLCKFKSFWPGLHHQDICLPILRYILSLVNKYVVVTIIPVITHVIGYMAMSR